MKKLLALILTTALVFSLAAPAMAANWSTPGTTAASAVKITAFKKLVVTNNTLGGRPNYGEAPADTPVYPGSPIIVGATIEVPKDGTLPANLTAKFTFSNATVSSSNNAIRSTSSLDLSVSLLNGSKTAEIPLIAGTNTVIVPAFVTAAGSVEVSLAVSSAGSLKVNEARSYSNGLTVTIKTTNTTPVSASVLDKGGNELSFEFLSLSESNYACTVKPYSWKITLGNGDQYTINDTNGNRTYTKGADSITSSHYYYSTINGIYEAFAQKLGFNYTTKSVIFSPENVEVNFGNSGEAQTVVYNAYSGLPTLPTNPTTPPVVTTPALGNGTTTGKVNMRQGPSTSKKKLTTLKKGVSLKLISLSNGWYEVEYNGLQGYVSAKYIKRK